MSAWVTRWGAPMLAIFGTAITGFQRKRPQPGGGAGAAFIERLWGKPSGSISPSDPMAIGSEAAKCVRPLYVGAVCGSRWGGPGLHRKPYQGPTLCLTLALAGPGKIAIDRYAPRFHSGAPCGSR